MKFLVKVNYTAFLFDDENTADKFAAIAKSHIVNTDGKKDTVLNEYLTDEEATEYEARN